MRGLTVSSAAVTKSVAPVMLFGGGAKTAPKKGAKKVKKVAKKGCHRRH